MIRAGCLSSLVTIGVMMSGTAHAQEPGKVGITVQYPTSIGILWHASDKIALRPDITYSGSSVGSSSGSGSSSWNVGAELAVLFYLKQYDHLRTYFAPRVDYGYSHSHVDIGSATSASGSVDTSRWGAGATGLFGAHYSPVTRFGVFAELGFGYSHSTIPTVATLSGSGNSWGTRAAVGAVFYP